MLDQYTCFGFQTGHKLAIQYSIEIINEVGPQDAMLLGAS